ncbi:MAG: hypothetical protein RLZZ387_869 [Chloroflexota bacterium]
MIADTPPRSEDAADLSAAVRTIAAGTAPDADRLAAVRRLRRAPPDLRWRRALVTALADLDRGVRDEARRACLDLVDALDQDRARQGDLIGELLDACLSYRNDATADTRAELLLEIVALLVRPPAAHPHHRARILAHAAGEGLLRQPPQVALALLRALHRLAEDQQSGESAAARALDERQRRRLFVTPGTPAPLLELYLRRDSALDPAAVQPGLLREYAALLATAPHTPAALALLRNLCRWLHEAPRATAQWRTLLPDAVRASQGADLAALEPRVRLQILAGAALLGGSGAPGDLLGTLRAHYTFADDRSAAELGLRALARLPQLRARIPELCTYLGDPATAAAGEVFWDAALDLLHSLATGLSETAPLALQGRSAGDRWPTRLGWQIAARDHRLRRLLAELSERAALPPSARAASWRTLLLTVPQSGEERAELYAAGLRDVDSERFLPTLAAAGETCEREVWRHIAAIWDELTAGDAGTADRRERLLAICRLFGRICPPDAVEPQAGAAPPMIALAQSDPDPAVRRAAEEVLRDAGLAVGLEYEQRRAALARLRVEAERLHDEAERLGREHAAVDERRAGLASELADLSQRIAAQRQEREELNQTHSVRLREYELSLPATLREREAIGGEQQAHETSIVRLRADIARNTRERQAKQARLNADQRAAATLEMHLEELRQQQRPLSWASVRLWASWLGGRQRGQPTHEQLQREQETAEQQLADLRAEIDRLTLEIEEGAAQERRWQAELEGHGRGSRQNEARLRELEEERQRQQRRLEEEKSTYRTRLEAFEYQISRLGFQQNTVRHKLEDAEREQRAKEDELRRHEGRASQLREQAAEATDAEERLRGEARRATATADTQAARVQAQLRHETWRGQEISILYTACIEQAQIRALAATRDSETGAPAL